MLSVVETEVAAIANLTTGFASAPSTTDVMAMVALRFMVPADRIAHTQALFPPDTSFITEMTGSEADRRALQSVEIPDCIALHASVSVAKVQHLTYKTLPNIPPALGFGNRSLISALAAACTAGNISEMPNWQNASLAKQLLEIAVVAVAQLPINCEPGGRACVDDYMNVFAAAGVSSTFLPPSPPLPPTAPPPSSPPPVLAPPTPITPLLSGSFDLSGQAGTISNGASTAEVLAVSVASSVSILASTSIGVTVATSAATAIGSAVGGAVSSAGSSSTAGSASSASSGGGVLPLMMGVQRFALSSGLAIKTSELQSLVSGSMQSSWMCGELDFVALVDLGTDVGRRVRRRRLQLPGTNSISNTTNITAPNDSYFTPECAVMANRGITGSICVTCVCLIQLILVCLWKHWINRHWYTEAESMAPMNLKWTKKKSRFYPFPKSLAWPTPLLFICCVFVTGLTTASVDILFTWLYMQDDRSSIGCRLSAGCCLALIVGFVTFMTCDIRVFEKSKRRKGIEWKAAKNMLTVTEVADPTMQLRAKIQATRRAVWDRISMPLKSTGERRVSRSRVMPRCESSAKDASTTTDASPSPTPINPSARIDGVKSRTPPPSPPLSPPSRPRYSTPTSASFNRSTSNARVPLTSTATAATNSGEGRDGEEFVLRLQMAWRERDARMELRRRRVAWNESERELAAVVMLQSQFRKHKASVYLAQLRAESALCRMARNWKGRRLCDNNAPTTNGIVQMRISIRPHPPHPSRTAWDATPTREAGADVQVVTSDASAPASPVVPTPPRTAPASATAVARRPKRGVVLGNQAEVNLQAVVARKYLMERGYRDRKQGAFGGLPPADSAEPARTERLLQHPFALWRNRAGDSMQVREGFILFRVNGRHRITTYYRVILVAANVLFGALSGAGSALTGMPVSALVQVASVLSLQLVLAIFCCCLTPDADRVISSSSGTQYLMEGASTGLLFFADVASRLRAEAEARVQANINSTQVETMISEEDERTIREIAFWIALLAVVVPMVQLLEQRMITPAVLAIRTKKLNTTSIIASLYMLATSLPRLIQGLIGRAEMADSTSGQNTVSASAAGEDGESGDHLQSSEEGSVGLTGNDAYFMADQVSRLLARSMAAKEATSKQVELSAARDVNDSMDQARHVIHERRSGLISTRSMRSASGRRSQGEDMHRSGGSDKNLGKAEDRRKADNEEMLEEILEENEPDAGGGD